MSSVLTPLFGSLVPSAKMQTLSSNYIDFTASGVNFAQQYLPELYEQEVERYGNRTLSGFLRMVGAELPMASDQVIWSEQNRLHISYDDCSVDANDNIIAIGNKKLNGTSETIVEHAIRVGALVVVIDPATGTEWKAAVTEKTTGVDNNTITVQPFGAGVTDFGSSPLTGLKVFVFGSSFAKGTYGMQDSVTPQFTTYTNSPIIIKDRYDVSGSDAAQIGWVEVTTEAGATGYLWYLKAESETRLRFEDYLEMTMIEAEPAGAASGAADAGVKGSDGLFYAITQRGNVNAGFDASLTSFDTILKNLDTQGAIAENMIYADRETNLMFDDMLATLTVAGVNGLGVGFGLFQNEKDMALNLGFTGFRRGSYDFYKTDWKYLNDASTRGKSVGMSTGTDAIKGVIVPAGTSTVYDQILGKNIRRPFLHVRYRASEADDRRLKSWITGSVGGAHTSDIDAMQVHFLSERCLCVQGANNFVLLKA